MSKIGRNEGKALITGGAGFIASHLAESLHKLNYNLTILDNLSTGSRRNLTNLGSYRFIHGDIRDPLVVYDTIMKDRPDVMYHAAAQISVDRGIVDPVTTNLMNVVGTLNVIQALRMVKKQPLLVYFSSCEVYGDAEYIPMDESHPLKPKTPYAASKLAAEKYILTYVTTYNLPAIVVRPFNVFGPRQRGGEYGAVIPNFIERVMRGLPPIIHGRGDQTRDFTYVEDVAEAFASLATRRDLVGEVINLGSGTEICIADLAGMVLRIMGRDDLKLIHVPHPRKVSDLIRQKSDPTKARKLIGFDPQTRFEEGLKKTIDFYREIMATQTVRGVH